MPSRTLRLLFFFLFFLVGIRWAGSLMMGWLAPLMERLGSNLVCVCTCLLVSLCQYAASIRRPSPSSPTHPDQSCRVKGRVPPARGPDARRSHHRVVSSIGRLCLPPARHYPHGIDNQGASSAWHRLRRRGRPHRFLSFLYFFRPIFLTVIPF
ncbi:hypothetical protein LZ31DRAFT_161948 [Colletotrichum somersetense]|nr:hypothetical protein LZ31DRAFT_161948 [Colletotrichum somersetense]